jgi:uncharacterized protein (TIGR02246 family)
MRSRFTPGVRALVLGGLVVAAVAYGGRLPHSAGQPGGSPATRPTATVSGAIQDRPADREGVEKALKSFTEAFQKADGKAVAGLWTLEGEYIGDDGTSFRGRDAIAKAYAEFFEKNPENLLEVEVESIRFPSRDNGVVEGHFKLHMGKQKELIVSRCSFLYAREDGKWLIAIAREWPGDGLALRDLEWLIGTWEAKREGTTVTTKYEWTKNKAFIRCNFTIVKDGEEATGMQMIGKMPSTGGLHSWTFEDSGGIGDADLSRDGKKWLFTARGSTADGNVITATNIMTPIDANSFLWQSVDRWMDDEPLDDVAPIKVTRVKAKR